MSKRPPHAVIFDLDGTLWDARGNICVSWNDTLGRLYSGCEYIPEGDFTAQMGKLLPDIGDALLPWIEDKNERDRAVELCCEDENVYLAEHGGIYFENEESTLRALSEKYDLYIVSNCQGGYIEAFYAASGMEKYFAGKTCSGDTGMEKGDNIRYIIEKYGIERAVYVGDTILDQKAADYAGVPFIWAAYGFGEPEHCVAKAESFADLGELCGAVLEEDGRWQ